MDKIRISQDGKYVHIDVDDVYVVFHSASLLREGRAFGVLFGNKEVGSITYSDYEELKKNKRFFFQPFVGMDLSKLDDFSYTAGNGVSTYSSIANPSSGTGKNFCLLSPNPDLNLEQLDGSIILLESPKSFLSKEQLRDEYAGRLVKKMLQDV